MEYWKVPKCDWTKLDCSGNFSKIQRIKLYPLPREPFWCQHMAIPDIFNNRGEITYWHFTRVNIISFIFLYIKWWLIIYFKKHKRR